VLQYLYFLSCVRFNVVSIELSDRLGRTYLKWHILVLNGTKTIIQLVLLWLPIKFSWLPDKFLACIMNICVSSGIGNSAEENTDKKHPNLNALVATHKVGEQ